MAQEADGLHKSLWGNTEEELWGRIEGVFALGVVKGELTRFAVELILASHCHYSH